MRIGNEVDQELGNILLLGKTMRHSSNQCCNGGRGASKRVDVIAKEVAMSFSINARPGRKYLDAATEHFFRSVIDFAPFAVYGCLTFAAKVDVTQAIGHFHGLIKHALSTWKDNVAWLLATERVSSGCSDPTERPLHLYETALHIHFTAISHGVLSPERMSRYWSAALGNCKIEKYDASRDGISYILKFRNHDRCDWAFSDTLYLFQPGYQPRNKFQRRAFKRQAVRDAKRSLSRQMLTLPVPNPIASLDAPACSSTKVSDNVTEITDYQIHPDAILQALDAEIDLLRNVRALLIGETAPSTHDRPTETKSIATKKRGRAWPQRYSIDE